MKNWHGISAELSSYQKQLEQGWRQLSEQEIVDRIWRKDHTVWKESPHEITNRLGWLDSPRLMKSAVSDINSFINELHAEGFTQALLLGMGGSSLAPEVFSKTFESEKAGIALKVLDSTDPGAVLEKARFARSGKTIFIVSTKSGGTVETISFMKYFYRMIADSYGSAGAGDFFTAITDAGSGLESMARALKYRKIFINNPEIGGRYSALSYFGLVPAALTGVDIDKLLERADELAQKTRHGSDDSAAALGVIMGTLALLGRDKVTLKLTSGVRYFGSWIEQLIAESTGKEGKGILPVDSEPPVQTDYYGPDRLFVYIKLQNETDYDRDFGNIAAAGHPVIELALQDKYDLGSEFFRWELATVIAGYFLKINPFDQPNVESAKKLATQKVTEFGEQGKLVKPANALILDDLTVYSPLQADSLQKLLGAFFNLAQKGDLYSLRLRINDIRSYLRASSD